MSCMYGRGPWKTTVKLKHLLTESDEYEDVEKSMLAIKVVLSASPDFSDFPKDVFDELKNKKVLGMSPVEQANHILSKVYDYADMARIWID